MVLGFACLQSMDLPANVCRGCLSTSSALCSFSKSMKQNGRRFCLILSMGASI